MAIDQPEASSFRHALTTAREHAADVGARCTFVLDALARHAKAIGYTDEAFRQTVQLLWTEELGEAGGDDFLASLVEITTAEPEEAVMPAEHVALNAAAAYAVQAIKADKSGNPTEAWAYAFDAAQWEGVLSGLLASRKGQAAVSAEVNSRTWEVHAPERSDMLADLLYRSLKQAHDAGDRRPTATQMLAKWLADQPAGFTVTSASISWLDANADKQIANLENVGDRIKRMTRRKGR